jgi:hypothetical protein
LIFLFCLLPRQKAGFEGEAEAILEVTDNYKFYGWDIVLTDSEGNAAASHMRQREILTGI